MLKSFDFFRKIQTDQELTSATGGIFTIIAMIVASLLILFSFQDFMQERYFTFLAVKHDNSEFLPMRLDILFNKLPCEVLTIQFHDELQYIESNLQNKLTLYNVPKGAESGEVYSRNSNHEIEIQSLKNHIKQGYQCRVIGILPLPKTPGQLSFKTSAQNNLIQNADPNAMQDVKMSYRINSLEFGTGNNTFDFPISHKSKNIEKYIKDLEGNVKTRQFVQDTFFNEVEPLDYFNHVKIIPVIFQEENKKSHKTEESQNYRYSLRSGWAGSDIYSQKLQFLTEIEPINIIYRKHESSVYDLVVQLLAIVGGTVATIGIVNSLSHFFLNIQNS